MTFDQEMEKFWRRMRQAQRQLVESDPFYQAAVRNADATKAQERACEIAFDEKAVRKFIKEKTWAELERVIEGGEPN